MATINKGSEWRKWDLQVHTPYTKLANNYKFKDQGNTEIWDEYCRIINSSDVAAIGITDYFSVDNYYIFVEHFKLKYPNSRKLFLPNIEFRLEVSVNKQAEEVNIHLIFNHNTPKIKIESFLNKLNTNITRNSANVSCLHLENRRTGQCQRPNLYRLTNQK